MAPLNRASCALVICLAACRKDPLPGPPDRAGDLHDAAKAAAPTAPAVDESEIRRKLVGRWVVVRDVFGHAIAPDVADVVEVRDDGTLAEVQGTHRDEQRWRLSDVSGNGAKLKKLSLDPALKMESEWLPFTIEPDGAIEFATTKQRWVRQAEPPKVATTAEMSAFVALLDGTPGAGKRAAQKFGAASATLTLLHEVDYKAVRVARVRQRAADTCYVLLANASYLDVCWRGGKVTSVEELDRAAEK